jgi:hypothetical protein
VEDNYNQLGQLKNHQQEVLAVEDNYNIISISTTGDFVASDLTISIDNCPVDFEINDHMIEIAVPIEFGVHTLKIVNCSDNRITFAQVSINNASLRKLLYLSWTITASGQRIQPCTEIWERDQCWILPFGNPLSHWIAVAETKISNDYYGKDLSEHFCIWYPDRLELPDQFPQTVRDFFNHNFDFTVVSQSNFDYRRVPYVKLQDQLDAELLTNATTEIINNTDMVITRGIGYGQLADNQTEFNLSDKQIWKRVWLKRRDRPRAQQEQFAATWQLIDSLDLEIWSVFVGVLPPGGFIYPHTDNTTDKDLENSPYVGCVHLYIPINWPKNNYIKFNNAGILSMEDGPMIVNTDRFTHAVVNNSNQYRHALIIGLNKNNIPQFL